MLNYRMVSFMASLKFNLSDSCFFPNGSGGGDVFAGRRFGVQKRFFFKVSQEVVACPWLRSVYGGSYRNFPCQGVFRNWDVVSRGKRGTCDIPFHTLYFTLYTLHFTLCTPHSTRYTLHITLYTLHFTLYTPHFTLHTLHSTLYTPHFTLYTPHTLHFTLYTLHSTIPTPQSTLFIPTSHSPLHTLDTPHFTLYTRRSTLYTLHFALYTLHFTLRTPQFTLYALHFTLQHPTLHTLHCTLHTWHSTFHSLHTTLYVIPLLWSFMCFAFGFVGLSCFFLDVSMKGHGFHRFRPERSSMSKRTGCTILGKVTRAKSLRWKIHQP